MKMRKGVLRENRGKGEGRKKGEEETD